MRNLEAAQQLLQRAYNEQEIKLPQDLETVGVQTLHIAFYDSGLAQHEEIRFHIKEFPTGQLVRLIFALREARLGDYEKTTLDEMYGLTGILP